MQMHHYIQAWIQPEYLFSRHHGSTKNWI